MFQSRITGLLNKTEALEGHKPIFLRLLGKINVERTSQQLPTVHIEVQKFNSSASTPDQIPSEQIDRSLEQVHEIEQKLNERPIYILLWNAVYFKFFYF